MNTSYINIVDQNNSAKTHSFRMNQGRLEYNQLINGHAFYRRWTKVNDLSFGYAYLLKGTVFYKHLESLENSYKLNRDVKRKKERSFKQLLQQRLVFPQYTLSERFC